MRMFICTSPRMQPLSSCCALFAVLLLNSPLAAQQNTQVHGSGAQSSLQIKVNVVRVLGLHRHHRDKDRDENEAIVSYDLKPRHEEFSVTEDVRPMLVDSGNDAARQEQVRTISIVLK